jgi:hypothetical protein
MEEYRFKYYLIYTIASLICLVVATQIDYKKNKMLSKVSTSLAIAFCLIFIFLFGLRKDTIGTDTPNYLFQFDRFETIDFGNDVVMYYIYLLWNLLNLPFQTFLMAMSILFVGIISLSIHKNSIKFDSNSFLILFSFLSLFFFQSLGINVIRQGVSLSFLLLAIINYQNDNSVKKAWLLPMFISVIFHFTSIIPIVIYFLIIFFKKIKLKFFYFFYLVCFGLSIVSVSILSFKDYIGFLMVDERRMSSYLSGTDEIYTIGFKPQFVAFNTFFLFYFIYIKDNFLKDEYYDNILKYYITMSGIFFLTFQISYSDRWGLMSWIVIPILLAPVFSLQFHKKRAVITCAILISIFIFFENYT